MTELTWNVFYSDADRIEPHNIFKHGRLMDDLRKAYRKYGRGKNPDRGAFLEDVRRSLMYYYWSKCEWEIVLDHWPHSDRKQARKVDVYDQIRLNWEHFCNYLWDNREALKHVDSNSKA